MHMRRGTRGAKHNKGRDRTRLRHLRQVVSAFEQRRHNSSLCPFTSANTVHNLSTITTTSGTPTRREYGGRRKVLTTYPAGLFHGTCVTRVSSTERSLFFATIISDKLNLAQNAQTHMREGKV